MLAQLLQKALENSQLHTQRVTGWQEQDLGSSRSWSPGQTRGSTVCTQLLPGQPRAAINGTDRSDSALAEGRGAANVPVLRPRAAAQPLPLARSSPGSGCRLHSSGLSSPGLLLQASSRTRAHAGSAPLGAGFVLERLCPSQTGGVPGVGSTGSSPG